MKKNVQVIDDDIEDMVAPVVPVVPKKAEEIIKNVPVAPETIPTEPLEEIIPKNPLEELEKQKDATPDLMPVPEILLTPEEREVLND
jgi:hypothetical protein